MTPARKITPPPAPTSHTRATTRRPIEALRIDVHRLRPRVDDEVRALRTEADARRGQHLDGHAAHLDRDARELQDAMDELRWLASLSVGPRVTPSP